MNLHFIHVGKTGGTAIKEALREAGLAVEGPESRYVQRATCVPSTPYGQIVLHNHPFKLRHVPADDFAFFFLRDPITRFVSGFASRLRKGQPRYSIEWTQKERVIFERFPTPQSLAHGVGSKDEDEQELARWAINHIQHLRRFSRQVGDARLLYASLPRIVYIGRQETLDSDWRRLKPMLGLPDYLELPTDPVAAHRGDASVDASLDDSAIEILRDWYKADYKLLGICDRFRARNGWDGSSHARLGDRLRGWSEAHLAGSVARRLGGAETASLHRPRRKHASGSR
jgi:Sulfotransferase family